MENVCFKEPSLGTPPCNCATGQPFQNTGPLRGPRGKREVEWKMCVLKSRVCPRPSLNRSTYGTATRGNEQGRSAANLIAADLLLDLLDPTLQTKDLLLKTRLLTLQRRDLLLEARVLRLLMGEVALHLFLHALHIRHHRLLQLLQLRLVVLLDVLLVVAQGLDLLALRSKLLVLHRDEVLERCELPLQPSRRQRIERVARLVHRVQRGLHPGADFRGKEARVHRVQREHLLSRSLE